MTFRSESIFTLPAIRFIEEDGVNAKKIKVFGCGRKAKRAYRAWRRAGYSLDFSRKMVASDFFHPRTGREKLSPVSEKKTARLEKAASLFAK
jgi:hypothetical protein